MTESKSPFDSPESLARHNERLAKWWDDRQGRLEEFVGCVRRLVQLSAEELGYKDLTPGSSYDEVKIQEKVGNIRLTREEIDLFLFYRFPNEADPLGYTDTDGLKYCKKCAPSIRADWLNVFHPKDLILPAVVETAKEPIFCDKCQNDFRVI